MGNLTNHVKKVLLLVTGTFNRHSFVSLLHVFKLQLYLNSMANDKTDVEASTDKIVGVQDFEKKKWF